MRREGGRNGHECVAWGRGVELDGNHGMTKQPRAGSIDDAVERCEWYEELLIGVLRARLTDEPFSPVFPEGSKIDSAVSHDASLWTRSSD